MKFTIEKSPLLPVLTASTLTISTFAMNSHTLDWKQLPIPLAVSIAFALVLWVQFFIIPLTRKTAGFLGSLWAGLMLLWHIFPELPPKFTPVMIAGLIPALLVAIGTGLSAFFPKKINRALPTVAIVLAISMVLSLGLSTVQIGLRQPQSVKAMPMIVKKDLPDIYFIIPDRFGSPEALEESGLDCSEFVKALEDKGFYVRKNAMSDNTMTQDDIESSRTLCYMASALNMGIDVDPSYSYSRLSSMIRSPQVTSIAKSMGYEVHHIGSWYPETALDLQADYNYVYKGNSPMSYLYSDLFSSTIIDRSILRRLTLVGASEAERERHLFQMETVKQIASKHNKPKFVFVHLMLPHEPFVWAADGSLPETKGKTQMELYLGQAQFAKGFFLEMIDSIDRGSIVIIQSDEGIIFPKSKEETLKLSDTQFNGVLTAWRIPNTSTDVLDRINTRDVLKYVIEEVRK